MKALAAEMVGNFGKRLAPLGIAVRELTGDMQMTKSEVQSTQVSSKEAQAHVQYSLSPLVQVPELQTPLYYRQLPLEPSSSLYVRTLI